jgi:histidinol-phosphate aminotransferase
MSDSYKPTQRLLRPEVLALSAYHVQDSAGYIKLDAMENPYAWPEALMTPWLEKLQTVKTNRYPDPACLSLKNKLLKVHAVPPKADMLLGNGSDELIQIILMALKPGSIVVAPEPTFVMYRQISQTLGLEFKGIPLIADDFSLDIAAFKTLCAQQDPAVIFLAYPNNPTGNLFGSDEIKQILSSTQALVIVDEAYAPYADASFMSQVGESPNLLVMRTLSKLGLAGLRLGFMVGPEAWINEFEKIRLPYNINVLTQVTAEFALDHQSEFDAQVALIMEARHWLQGQLAQIDDIHVYPTKANFILIKLLRHDANAVFNYLKSAGILIKNMHPVGGVLSQCLRVTVGAPKENQLFLAAFIEAMNHVVARSDV